MSTEASAPSTSATPYAELGQLVAENMINAINDPHAQWDVLSEEEIATIKKRCEELLETVADRFQERGDVDFAKEFGMTLEQLVVAILCAAMEDNNNRNIKFDVLCDALQFDKGTYYMVKKFLGGKDDGDKTPKDLIMQTFCTPIDCCLALTMAYCEVCGWPFSCDWDSITYVNDTWTEEEQNEFDKLTREEAQRQWNAAKALLMDPNSSVQEPSEYMTQCAIIENQLKNWNDTADKVLADMHDLVASMDRAVLVEKHDAVVKERNQAIADLVPQSVSDRPLMTDEEIKKVRE
ncbi:unnamed protein product [Cylicostephanus goldi]|uniref:Uncharacterized protein n=1 Tax=Cylicostephanus goldi TaxID=71465 RepID=A0A3P7MCZ3_CYLGO|nr:unnamed protein product [Cylicostephanus goldi]